MGVIVAAHNDERPERDPTHGVLGDVVVDFQPGVGEEA